MSELLAEFHDARRLEFAKYVRSRGYGAHDAEDIVSEAFLTLHEACDKFEGADNRTGFAFRILMNTIADSTRLRERRPALPVDPHTLATGGWATGDPSDEVIPRVDLQRAIDRLPERQAQCLRLFYYARLKGTEIADCLDISPSTVESHLSQARCNLEKNLAGYGSHSSKEAKRR